MYFKIYDYISGDVIDQASELNFGDIIQKQHCLKPVVVRAFSDIESTVSDLKIYLENKGRWKDTEYGYYLSSTFESSIESGSSKLSDHFVEVPNATVLSLNGVPIGWDTTSSDFIWLDSQITESDGMSEANFRLFYDYTGIGQEFYR